MRCAITRLRATYTTDPYSGVASKESWANPSRLVIDNCVLAPASATETITVNEATTQTTMTLYTPVDADITSTDRVLDANGVTWAIDGEAQVYRSPFSNWGPGAVFRLRKL